MSTAPVPTRAAPPAEVLKRQLLVLNAEREARNLKPVSCAALAHAVNTQPEEQLLALSKATISRILNGKLASPYEPEYRRRLAAAIAAEFDSIGAQVTPAYQWDGHSCPSPETRAPKPATRKKRYTSDAHLGREERVSPEGFVWYGRHCYYAGALFAGMVCNVKADVPRGTVKITGLLATRHLSPIDPSNNQLGYTDRRIKAHQVKQCTACGAQQ